jgi:hypothetical protein
MRLDLLLVGVKFFRVKGVNPLVEGGEIIGVCVDSFELLFPGSLEEEE